MMADAGQESREEVGLEDGQDPNRCFLLMLLAVGIAPLIRLSPSKTFIAHTCSFPSH